MTTTTIVTTLPPLPTRANGFQTSILAATPVEVEGDNVDAVGAVVEAGCGVVDVAMVVGAAAVGDEEEVDMMEEVVALAGTGAVVFVLETQLPPAAVPV